MDLSNNAKIHTVLARSSATNSDIYQAYVVENIVELLEFAGLPLDLGNEIKVLTMDIITNSPLDLILNSSAPIKSINTKSKSYIDLKDSSHLVSAYGNFTVSTISAAGQLEIFSGGLFGDKILDISNSNSLTSFQFESDVIEEIRIPSSLLILSSVSLIVRFLSEDGARLKNLRLISKSSERMVFNENDINIKSLPLEDLYISNYNMGRALVLSDLSQLLHLELHNNYIDIALEIPDSLRHLKISSAEHSHAIYPGDNLNRINLADVSSGFCTLDGYSFTSLVSLYITECKNSSIDLTNTPSLYGLYVDNSDVEEIDLSAVLKLKKLRLIDTKVRTIDFSSVSEDNKLDSFVFDSKYATDEERSEIKDKAIRFSESVYVN